MTKKVKTKLKKSKDLIKCILSQTYIIKHKISFSYSLYLSVYYDRLNIAKGFYEQAVILSSIIPAVKWPIYCQSGVKHYILNQSMN